MKNLVARASVALTFLLVSATGFAQTDGGGGAGSLDVTPVTDHISGSVTTGLASVGGAVLVAAVTAMGFKWIKGMIFS